MGSLKDVKTGDHIVIETGSNRRLRVDLVHKVTPSGIVVTKTGRWNPDGTPRPRRHGFFEPQAMPATPELVAKYARQDLIDKVKAKFYDKGFEALPDALLRSILAEYQKHE